MNRDIVTVVWLQLKQASGKGVFIVATAEKSRRWASDTGVSRSGFFPSVFCLGLLHS